MLYFPLFHEFPPSYGCSTAEHRVLQFPNKHSPASGKGRETYMEYPVPQPSLRSLANISGSRRAPDTRRSTYKGFISSISSSLQFFPAGSPDRYIRMNMEPVKGILAPLGLNTKSFQDILVCISGPSATTDNLGYGQKLVVVGGTVETLARASISTWNGFVDCSYFPFRRRIAR